MNESAFPGTQHLPSSTEPISSPTTEPFAPADHAGTSTEPSRPSHRTVVPPGYAEMPLPQPVEVPVEEWLRDEATVPEGSFAAFAGSDPVGYAGLLSRPGGKVAEHGLTAVHRDFRRRGIALALKRAVIHWASQNGVGELVTWTQRGNEAMQALNRKLGYVDRERVLTFQGPLP